MNKSVLKFVMLALAVTACFAQAQEETCTEQQTDNLLAARVAQLEKTVAQLTSQLRNRANDCKTCLRKEFNHQFSSVKGSVNNIRSEIQSNLNAQIAKLNNKLYKSNFWTPVNKAHVGGYHFRGTVEKYAVSESVVPKKATQILVQIEWSTGWTPNTQFIRTAIYTKHNDGREFKTWADGWRFTANVNYSDNHSIWLPIAETDRHIYVHSKDNPAEATRNLHMGIWVLGWK